MSYHYEHTPSPNYSAGRPYGPPDHITIHWWGRDGQSHAAVRDYLRRYGGDTSAHEVISAGLVSHLVDFTDRAWHAGPSGNPRGIGLELRPEMSEGDFLTAAERIANIRREYGPLPLRPHCDHLPTDCPGRWFPHLQRLSDLANQILAGTYRKEDDMTPEDRKILHDMSWLMRNSYGPAIARLDQARVEEKAWRDSMTATIQALAIAKGVDPAAVMSAVETAVARALEGLEVTLTAQPEGGAR